MLHRVGLAMLASIRGQDNRTPQTVELMDIIDEMPAGIPLPTMPEASVTGADAVAGGEAFMILRQHKELFIKSRKLLNPPKQTLRWGGELEVNPLLDLASRSIDLCDNRNLGVISRPPTHSNTRTNTPTPIHTPKKATQSSDLRFLWHL